MVSKFKQTDIGLIPEDWDCLCLVDPQVGYIVNGLTYKPENVKRHGTLILRSANIKNGRLSFDDNVYVNCAIPHNLLVRKNDVLICNLHKYRRYLFLFSISKKMSGNLDSITIARVGASDRAAGYLLPARPQYR